MIGAIVGDIAGSRFEWRNHRYKEFELLTRDGGCRPTDDSVMTLAVAAALLDADGNAAALSDFAVRRMQELGQTYPHAGYGGSFRRWLADSDPQPYGSWGNGAAMRVSPCGWAAKTLDEAILYAVTVTAVTHNHPEALKAAAAVSSAIWLARQGADLNEIRAHIASRYYVVDFTPDDIRDDYTFDVSCQGSVPQAFSALFAAEDFEDAVRNAVSIGGDSDTIAAITGSMAEPLFGVPDNIRADAESFLDETLLTTLRAFESRFGA